MEPGESKQDILGQLLNREVKEIRSYLFASSLGLTYLQPQRFHLLRKTLHLFLLVSKLAHEPLLV